MKQAWKKVIGIILSAAMCLQLCSLCVGAADGSVDLSGFKEVAAGKPNGFGGPNSWDYYSANCLTDGSVEYTGQTMLGKGGAPGEDMYAYINLGSAQKIAYIEVMTYDPNDGAGSYILSVTNEDPTNGVPANKTVVAQEPSLTESKTVDVGYITYEVPEPANQEPNRYVLLEKVTEAARCFVQEVKVYVQAGEESQLKEIAHGKPNGWGVNAGGEFDYPPTRDTGNLLTDGDTSLAKAVGDINPYEGEYVYIDLEKAQKISYLNIVAYDANGAGNFDIYLTNTNPADGVPQDAALVGEVPFVDGAVGGDIDACTADYYVPAEYADQAFRYVVLARKDAPGRFKLEEVKVYSDGEEEPLPEPGANIALGKPNGWGANPNTHFDVPPTTDPGNRLTDGSTDAALAVVDYDDPPSDGSEYVYVDLEKAYKLSYLEIVAYGANGSGNFDIYLTNTDPADGVPADKALIGSVPRGTVPTAEQGTTIHNVPAEYTDQAYRYIVLARASAEGRFVMNEVRAYAQYEMLPDDVVDVAAGKPNGGGVNDGEELDFNPTSNNALTDGDPDTYGGDVNPYAGEYLYIDLESAQKISYFEIIAYDAVGNSGGADIYLTNTKPTGGVPQDAALVGEIPVRFADTAVAGTDTYVVPAGYAEQAYRYILFARKSDAGRFRVNDVKAFTKADNLQFGLSNAEFTVSGGNITVSGKVTNGSTESAVALLSAYDSKGKFIGAQAADVTLPTLCASKTWSQSFDAADLLAGSPARVDMVFLSDMTDRELLFMAENVTGETQVTSLTRGSGSFTYSAEQDRQNILLSGTAPGSMVMVMVLDAGESFGSLTAADMAEKVLYCGSVPTAADGSYSITAQMPDGAATGSYPLGFALAGTTTSEKTTSFAYSNFDQNAIVAAFKAATETAFAGVMEQYGFLFESLETDITAAGANFGKSFVLARECMKLFRCNSEVTEIASVDDVETVLRAALLIHSTVYTTDFKAMVDRYKDSMPLIFGKYYDGDEFETVLNMQKDNIDLVTAENVYNTYQKTMGLCAILNGSNSDKVYALENYAPFLGISEDDVGDASLADIAKKLGNSLEDIDSYLGGMGKVVRDAAEKIKNTGDDGTKRVTGGGGGGGGKNPPTMAFPYVDTNEETETEEPAEATADYLDLAGYDWAKSAILNLTRQKILKGISENQFAPERLLSRGEAAKMIVLSFGLTESDEEIVYNDCDITAWYYPYVESASANGLMVGVDRHTFGVNNSITRQDMAVVLSRALAKQGIWLKGDQELSFTDTGSIAPYAVDSVQLLSELGIITGADDGAFYPQECITRAQAAVMIDRVLTLLDEQ